MPEPFVGPKYPGHVPDGSPSDSDADQLCLSYGPPLITRTGHVFTSLCLEEEDFSLGVSCSVRPWKNRVRVLSPIRLMGGRSSFATKLEKRVFLKGYFQCQVTRVDDIRGNENGTSEGGIRRGFLWRPRLGKCVARLDGLERNECSPPPVPQRFFCMTGIRTADALNQPESVDSEQLEECVTLEALSANLCLLAFMPLFQC
ncbi:hypothetical protein CDAR_519571 [Caerostris darwini]|uniref:Uncharacterized protein n=1 Tax=Caerostris darwini TaxID=1538125 RepID=A0AAV4TKW7_9ARAC|nr:hypothetical protein CDAR_519571 [Caerostris darwini]